MTYRFPLWINLLGLKFKLTGLLLVQLFVMDPVVAVFTVELPLCYGLLWLVEGRYYRELTVLYFAVVVWRFTQQMFASSGNAKPDEPLMQPPGSQGRLASLLEIVRKDFGGPAYKGVAFPLSPLPWRTFGCSALVARRRARVAVVPVGCLGIYSIFDLRCELAHALVHERSRLILPACEANVEILAQAATGNRLKRTKNWHARLIFRLRGEYLKTLGMWHCFADLAADEQVAAQYGAFAVSSWIQRGQLANYSVKVCLAGKIGALGESGNLLPIVETCRGFHLLLESKWLDSIRTKMLAKERSPETKVSPMIVRLGALQHGLETAGGMDPRTAASLVESVGELEELAFRHETGLPATGAFRRPESSEIATVVLIPMMRAEVDRNSKLVEGWTIRDVPGFAKRTDELASRYKEDAGLLLAPVQRRALVPWLLTSFLAIRLLERGWIPLYSTEEGLSMTCNDKTLRPGEIIQQLVQAKMSEDEFYLLIE